MRIPKSFGRRSTADDKVLEPKTKYILAFEGEKTEVQYFSGIIVFKKKLGINKLFKIIPLIRHFEERTWSHPCKFIGSLIRKLDESSTGQILVESVVQHSIDCHVDMGIIDQSGQNNSSEISERLHSKLAESGYAKKDIVEDQGAILYCICECLYDMFPEEYTDKSIDDLQQYIKEQELYYNSEVDRVCLVVDRDVQNFNLNQYNSLLSACDKRKFSLYVSNPCFELWLLMHFPKVLELDREKMLENRNHSGNRRYLEVELRKLLPGFTKNNVQFENLVERVDDAILHEQNFCEDVEGLKNNLGSNVGLLLKELKEEM